MPNSLDQTASNDLLVAYREGLFSYDELVQAAGPELGALAEQSPETAIYMVGAFGGTDIWIPTDAAEGSRLRSVLDETDAKRVVDIYRGCRLKIPTLNRLKLALRRRKVAALREQGWKLAELAIHFRLTDRQILNILKKHRETAE